MEGWSRLRSCALIVVAGVLVLGGCGSSSADEGEGQAESTPKDASSKAEANDPGQQTTGAESKPTDRVETAVAPMKRYAVLEVVDGDTVHVAYRGDTTIRVIGIDTPETVDPGAPVECGGPRASATAHRLLDGKNVGLVFDKSQGRKDQYGRTLAYLQVPGTGDFGLTMIKKGRAAEYTYASAYKRQSRYITAEKRARNTDRGLWGKCGGPHIAPELEAPAPTTQTPAPEEQPPEEGTAAR